jgi:hypothetical protein
MKALIKNVLMGLCAGALLTMNSACTNLDETLYDQLTNDNIDLNDEANLELMIGAAVTNYRYLIGDWFGMFYAIEETTDQFMTPKRIGVGWGDAYINMHKHNSTYEVAQTANPWTFCYQGISYANIVLDTMGDNADPESEANVRFWRAMFYYHLLDLYGNVPLQTTMNVPDGYLPEQVGLENLYNWIVEEFKYVKENIGTTKYFGYGNKYVACMALAKMYLNKNSYLGTTGTDGYELALAEVETVINEGGYSLAPNYTDNFVENISSSPEIIFAVPNDRTHTSQFGIQSYCFPQTGLEAYGSTAAGYNGSCAIPQWIRTYDVDDQRLDYTWAGGLQHYAVKNDDGTYTPNAGDPIPFADDDWSGTGYLNYNLNVHSIDNPGAFQQEGYRLHKYEILGGNNQGTTATDVAIFRYADALMIKAECLLRLGRDEQTAADLVTQVRRRSFGNATSKATRTVADLKGGSVYAYGHEEYTGATCTDWSGAIMTHEGGDDIEFGGLLDDLGWEFACELHRRQDLRRFHMSDGRSVWNGKSWFCKDATDKTFYDVFPIPEDAIKSNIKLVQNPGY